MAKYDNFLHVYPQFTYHSPAVIRGSVSALKALQEAIAAAIESGRGQCITMATDGEGYAVEVDRCNTRKGIGAPFYWDVEGTQKLVEETEYRRQWRLGPQVTLSKEKYLQLCASAGEEPSRLAVMLMGDADHLPASGRR